MQYYISSIRIMQYLRYDFKLYEIQLSDGEQVRLFGSEEHGYNLDFTKGHWHEDDGYFVSHRADSAQEGLDLLKEIIS